ncbi:MAG: aminoacyl-tRNA hydrolase [Candidatus Paceibacterota bacterium]
MTTKLLIGIGNPDEAYRDTRHNIGFMFVDYLAKKLGAGDFELNKKLNAFIAKTKLGKNILILAKPQTYVNKSGEAVAKLKNFYKVKPENIIIAQDDLDIEFGSFKNSLGKNSGGHKGIESIIKSLKTKNFWRIRFGISTSGLKKARQLSDKKRDEIVKSFVLSKLTKGEHEKIKILFKEALERMENL